MICCLSLQAQVITVEGFIRTESGNAADATVTWKASRKPEKLPVDKSGKFRFEADHNEIYTFEISHPECRGYKIVFNTNAPNSFLMEGETVFYMDLYLPADDLEPENVEIRYDESLNEYAYAQSYMKTFFLQEKHIKEQRLLAMDPPEETDTTSAAIIIEPVDTVVPEPVDTIVSVDVPEDTTGRYALLLEKRSVYNIAVFPTEEARQTALSKGEREALIAKNFVIIRKYDEAEKLGELYYGFINFGTGSGNIEITKEEFDRFVKVFQK